MAKYPGLVRRGKRGIYWFRRRIPAHLGLPEINVSLRTTDEGEAIGRWIIEDSKARKLFVSGPDDIAPSLPILSQREACEAYYAFRLTEERTYRQDIAKEALRDIPAFWAGDLIDLPATVMVPSHPNLAPELFWRALAAAFRASTMDSLEHAKLCAITFNVERYVGFIGGWNETELRKIAGGDVNLLAALARTEIKVCQDILADDASLLPQDEGAGGDVEEDDAPKLSAFTESYIARRGKGLSEERASTIRATVRDLTEIVGDKSVTTYTAADASGFEGVMLALPANWMKNRTLGKLTITKAAEKAKALGMQRQTAKNIRKKWAALSTVFEHAAHTYPVKNPFVAKALIVDDGVAANDQRDPFTAAELKVLFASDLPGPLHWLTWLGLCTGARLNELCQLSKMLVREHEGLYYLYFSPGLRLKTGEGQSCVRALPLHAKLIEAGFLDYVAECSGALFPGLTRHKSGRYSDAQSKAFTRQLVELGIKRPKLSFHSLRHTFSARFKTHAPRDVETRERLLGHVVAGVAGRYGGSYEAEAADMELLVHRAGVLQTVKF